MIGRAEFAAGLTAVGIAVRQAPDPATLAVYHDVLGPRTDADEWSRFIRWGLDGARWTWFPKLAELQDALREFQGARPLLVEATQAYERVLASGGYTPEGGAIWIYREVKESCGPAAAEAFLAAGGNSAFSTTWNEDKRRERFVAAYTEAVRDEPETALLPAGREVKALSAGDNLGPVTRAEARDLVEFIRKALPDMPDRPTRRETDARLSELEAQREALVGGAK